MYSLWVTCSSSNYILINSATGEYIQSYRTLERCLTFGLELLRSYKYLDTIKERGATDKFGMDHNDYYFNKDRTEVLNAYFDGKVVATKVLEVATTQDLEISYLRQTHPELFL